MDFTYFQPRIDVIIAALTLMGILYKFGRMFYGFLKNQINAIRKVHDQIDIIFKEITPNGGGSIKDKINQMSDQMNTNTVMTEKIFLRQRWILDNRDEPIFESSDDGTCIWVNKPYLKLIKQDYGYVLGNGWKNCIHEEDRERVINLWNDCIKDGRMYEDEYRIIDSTGKSIRVECVSVKTDKHGYIGSIKVLKNL